MKETKRMKRMARNGKSKVPGMSLTSLMDVFTILVFFLLVNSSAAEVLEAPKNIVLPISGVETKPNETVVIMVSDEKVLVQGEEVVSIQTIVDSKGEYITEISDKLKSLRKNIIGISTKVVSESREVTILSDKSIKFKVLNKIMASSSYAGYEKISMAVTQRGAKKPDQKSE